MNALFSQLLHQSLTAGWIILALLALRPLLKKVPRWVSCLLWSLPAARLLLPAAPESRVSLVPQQLTAGALNLTPVPMTHIPVPTTAEAAPAAQRFSWEAVLPWLWLAGMAALAVCALFSYIRLLRRVQVSIRVGDRVFICDNVRSPFILGLFRPRIYLPSDMDQNRAKLVLSHERSHLRRGDHLWKPLGYALLCLHWFNPLCWAAYILFCRDIEQACDEAVVKDMEAWEKKAYSAALAACSVPRSAIAACPLAFGEVGVKQRIRGILNYRKPKFWVMVLSAVLCAALTAGFLTDPVKASQPEAATRGPSPVEDYLTYPREVTVYSAADKASRELARYPAGMPISLDGLEVVDGSIWGYVQYQDGQTRGWISLDEIMDVFTNRQHRFSQKTPIYSSPSLQAKKLGRGEIGDVYLEHYMEPYGNNIWGYIEYQQGDTTILGWILLNEGEAPENSDPILTGTVSGPDNVNVRSGPGTSYRTMGFLEAGTEVSIFEIVTSDNLDWGRIDGNSWVCMRYIEHGVTASGDQEITFNNDPQDFAVENFTNSQETPIYSSPSEDGRVVYRLAPGQDYTILDTQPIADRLWAYIECNDGMTRGWMILGQEVPQVILEALSQPEIPVYRNPDQDSKILYTMTQGEDYTILEIQPIDNTVWAYIDCNGSKTQGWVCQTETTDPILTGTVIPTGLNVRSGPSTMEPAVGKLEEGTRVSIYEVVSQDNQQWGRIGLNAWVCMDYIAADSGDQPAPEEDDPIYHSAPQQTAMETYPFSQETKIYSSPSEQSREVYLAAAGEVGTITKREFIADGSWAYMVCNEGSVMGWVHLTEEDEALNYFREYVAAYSQPEPDEAEKYLYFASEYAREFFRDMYAPVTGWYPSGIFRVNGSLWGIEYSDSNSARMVYSFVGRMEDRLYVFQNVHQVPETLCENLDVTRYEEENAMYLSEAYMECSSVIKRLLPFANPTHVTLEDKGTRDYSAASPCPLEDVICGTDTWQEVEKPNSYGSPSCTIWLTTSNGSEATIFDSSPIITVSSSDGSQQYFQAAYTGEELVGMIYSWAKELS